ncbi:MAG: D-2-hydroxyacid dehydrogenase [Alphaproteobacteria bacterium]
MTSQADAGRRVHVHVKNNRSGEFVFRVTPERWKAAEARHPALARRIDATIDWDLDSFARSMRTAEALLTWDLPTDDLAARAPRLKWVHVIGAGIEHLVPLDWLPPGVTLVNNRGVHAPKAGEYGLMAILMLNNAMPAFHTRQREARFEPVYSTPAAGKTLLIVGVGRMGGAVARRAKQLGLRVVGLRRHGRPARGVDEMHRPEALDALLPQADFVVVTTPLTSETRGLIDRRRLDLLKPSAGLVNMSRAQVVDYAALADKLRAGTLAGAVLDVFDPEPLPPDSPLWRTPNLIMTPHVSSDDDVSYVPLTLDLFFDNLGRYLDGRPLRNRVRPKLGY